jgi:hypothetical protein
MKKSPTLDLPLEDSPSNVVAMPAVGPVRPKRRWKKGEASGRLIIPMDLPRVRPAKFRRSKQPFQIWKAPPIRGEEPPAPRTSIIIPFLDEALRFYARAIASLFETHFRPSH